MLNSLGNKIECPNNVNNLTFCSLALSKRQVIYGVRHYDKNSVLNET